MIWQDLPGFSLMTNSIPLKLSSLDELPKVLFGEMSDGVLVVDQDGIILDCNSAFCQRLGYDKSELLGRSVASLDSPEFALQVEWRLEQIEQAGRLTFETAHCRKDGGIMPVEISARVCEVAGEKAFFGVVRDISERKAAQAELLRRQTQLERAEAIAKIGSWELDLLSGELSWSDEIFRIFELAPARFKPSYEAFLSVIHPDDRDLVNDTYQGSLASGAPYEVSHRLLMDDGRIKWVKEQGQSFFLRGKAVRSVGTVQDITRKKLADDALRNSETLLHSLIETLPDLVWLKDRDGVYLRCNHRFEQFFGASEAEILGKTDYDFVDKELADFFRENDHCAIAAGEARINEETITFASDGHSEVLEVIKTPMYSAAGELIGVLGVGRDVTERKRIEAELQEGIEVYQAAINTPALGFWSVDGRGRLLEVNDAYVQQSGYSRDELLGMTIPDLEAKESAEETQAHIQEIMAKGFSRFRSYHRRRDGSQWPVEVITSFSSIQGGRFFAFLEDLTESIKKEQQLELAANVFETMNQAVVVTDAHNRIVSINPATSEITGYSFEELLGENPRIFASGRHDPEFYEDMWRNLEDTGHWDGEIWDRRKDGSVYPKWLTINAIHNSKGEVVQYVSVFSDITERKRTEELIWRQANYDSLTGLANRTLFKSRLQQEMERHSRDEGKIAVIYLDLDGFKDVNDSLGHAAGDRLLVEVAHRLEERSRKSDLVARLGGDEFTLMLVDIHQPEQVGAMAEEILEALKQTIRIMERELRIGASLGIAIYPDDGTSVDEITKHADVAMYQAKATGKNHFQFFQPQMNAMAQHRLTMIHDLHTAVETQDFSLYFQPKLCLEDNRVLGMEALLRWTRADGRMVSPAEFIPCAEETGLIIPIGGWILAEACHMTAVWNRRYDTRLKVAVNLSARQFRSSGLVEEVLGALQRSGLPAELLELEITESTLMEEVEQAIGVMKRLREAGISIAIDDFGTGYSSLSYLKRFPISTLKVDRSFVHELREGSEDEAIIKATIDLARSLNLEVVAEGIESEGQLQLLQRLSCYSGQGYHIGRPMDGETFEQFLQGRHGSLV